MDEKYTELAVCNEVACELPGVVVGSVKATLSMVNGLMVKSFVAVTFVSGFVPSVIVTFAL